MQPEFHTYDLGRVKAAFLYIPITGGAAESEFITIRREEKAFQTVKGNDGTVIRYKTGMRSCIATVSLLQGSRMNAVFSAIHAADVASDNGVGIGPFTLVDLNDASLLEAPHAWLQSTPDEMKFNAKPETRAWEIFIADPQIYNVGANIVLPFAPIAP